MAMTLRLSDEEVEALRERAEKDGTSMHEVVRLAVRDYVYVREHRDRVAEAATYVIEVHGDALRRLGE